MGFLEVCYKFCVKTYQTAFDSLSFEPFCFSVCFQTKKSKILLWYKIDVICGGLMGSPNLLANTQVKCLLAWRWFKFIVYGEIYCLIQGQSFSLICQCPLMFCLTDYLNPITGCRNSILHLLQLLMCPQRSYVEFNCLLIILNHIWLSHLNKV